MTGGLAYANTERSVALNSPVLAVGQAFSDDKTRWGWTMGFGTEWQFGFAQLELQERGALRPLRNGREHITHPGHSLRPRPPVRFEHESSAWVTRIGINYRFGGFGGGGPGY